MGAHTFGKNHVATSLFRYTWTSRGNTFFNNDYYKMITDDTRWYFNDDACTKVGDAHGNRPARRWLANYRWTSLISTSILWISATMAVCLSTMTTLQLQDGHEEWRPRVLDVRELRGSQLREGAR